MASFKIRGKDIEVTPPLREYVEKKVGKIIKYFDNIGEINILMEVKKGHHTIEVTVPVEDGVYLRGKESTPDMYSSIDLVVNKVERQIHKYKTRLAKRFQSGGFKYNLAVEEAKITPPLEDEAEYKIVKTKRYAVKPMDVQEAIMQMNLVNHDFYVFRNTETEEINVVYKRNDGNYGLIDPIS